MRRIAIAIVAAATILHAQAKPPANVPYFDMSKGEDLELRSKWLDIATTWKKLQGDTSALEKKVKALPEFTDREKDASQMEIDVNKAKDQAAKILKKHGLEGKLFYDWRSNTFVAEDPDKPAAKK